MKVTGHLRAKRGIWQMVFSYLDKDGKRRQKSESTGLPEKGNKRRALQMLDKRLKELSQQYIAPLDDKSQLFLNFMRDWLDNVMAYKVKETPWNSTALPSTATLPSTSPSMASSSKTSPRPCSKAITTSS